MSIKFCSKWPDPMPIRKRHIDSAYSLPETLFIPGHHHVDHANKQVRPVIVLLTTYSTENRCSRSHPAASRVEASHCHRFPISHVRLSTSVIDSAGRRIGWPVFNQRDALVFAASSIFTHVGGCVVHLRDPRFTPESLKFCYESSHYAIFTS